MSEMENSIINNSVNIISPIKYGGNKEGLKQILKEVTNDYNDRDLIKVLKLWLKSNPNLSEDSFQLPNKKLTSMSMSSVFESDQQPVKDCKPSMHHH